MTKQDEINYECYDLIADLTNLCSNLITDVTMATHFGLEVHDFSEQDLNKLKKIHDNFCKAYDEIPSFENIVRFEEKIE